MKKLLLLLAVFLSFGIQAVIAQSGNKLSGKLLDENGDGLPGASITVKGTKSGTITDIDGNYQLTLPEGKDVIVVEALGYPNKEIKVKNANEPLSISMTKSASDIGGGLVIYGQRIDPKTNVGAVTTVTAKDIEKKTITNVVNALVGSNGINITSGGGQPGSEPDLHVRGFGSLSASSAPLIVLDGMVYDGTLSSINPNDVETISLLKDATASSLYGNRGSNGVILVTSKRGQAGSKPRINFNAESGFVQRMLPPLQTINQAEYYKMSYDMLKNYYTKNGSVAPGGALNSSQMSTLWNVVLGGYNAYDVPQDQLINPATGQVDPNARLVYDDNWMDMLARSGIRHNYNLSVGSGTESGDYRFAVGYTKDQGTVKYTNYDRVTLKLTVNSKITDWLKTGVDFGGGFGNQRNFTSSTNAYSNPFMTAQTIAPIYPVFIHDTAGNVVLGPDGKPAYDFGDNPEYGQSRNFGKNTNVIASLQKDDRTGMTYNFRGVGYLEATILKDIKIRSDVSLDYGNYNNTWYGSSEFGDFSTIGGLIDKRFGTNVSYTWRQMLIWNPTFSIFGEGHNLGVTLNHENYLTTSNGYYFQRTGFTSPDFKQPDAAAVSGGSGGSISELAMESYLALGTYDYKGKYHLSGSFRRDGTSRFINNRWGNFWSIGAGWSLTEENFLKNKYDWLSLLKVRASYGTQGNQDVSGYYVALPTYYFTPNASHAGYSFNGWGNPDLKWEGKYSFNVGGDIGLYNNRITASLDYYRSGSNDLLYVRPYAPSVGIGGIYDNVGDMQNNGIELQIKGDVVRSRDFTWNIELNLQRNRNKITSMQDGSNDSIVGSGTIMAKGLPLNSYFLPEYAGVYKGAAEMDSSFQLGDELWRLADGSLTNDHTVASLNGNRKLYSPANERIVDGSFSSTLRYKNFDLFLQFTFGVGGNFFDNVYAQLMSPSNAMNGNTWSPDILNSWSYDNQDGDLPRLGIGENNIGKISNRFLMSASFFKIQSAKLGYNLPDAWMKTAKFTSAKIYVSADNIYLFTARKGVDIQQSYFGSNSLSYTPYRTVMFGLNLGF